jgi:hypothetical protein
MEIYELLDDLLNQLCNGVIRKDKLTFSNNLSLLDDLKKWGNTSNALQILYSRGYASEQTDNIIGITPRGREFILFGGFTEEKRKEKLMTDNIEASITSAKLATSLAGFQKRATRWTIVVASLTLIALVVQIVISVCGK